MYTQVLYSGFYWVSELEDYWVLLLLGFTPGGVLEFGFGGGVRLTTQNPYPFLGVILAENSARF